MDNQVGGQPLKRINNHTDSITQLDIKKDGEMNKKRNRQKNKQ